MCNMTLSGSASVSFTDEDNHKRRQRCQCLADGFFVNVSSMTLICGAKRWPLAPKQQPRTTWLVMTLSDWCLRPLMRQQLPISIHGVTQISEIKQDNLNLKCRYVLTMPLTNHIMKKEACLTKCVCL